MNRIPVVTAFLRHGDKILLLRRSKGVGTYQGRWAAVSGHLEEATGLEQAYREILEETGLSREQIRLRHRGQAFKVRDSDLDICWTVQPFLFEINEPDAIRLDWEHVAMRWVRPEQLRDFTTVPALAEALAACLRSPAESDGNRSG